MGEKEFEERSGYIQKVSKQENCYEIGKQSHLEPGYAKGALNCPAQDQSLIQKVLESPFDF